MSDTLVNIGARNKKIFSMTITLALVLVAFVAVLPAEVADGAIITVNGGGGGDYLTIQEAIDNATDGDTIQIVNGTYTESLLINATNANNLTIEGESEAGVIVQAGATLNSDYTIKIEAGAAGKTITFQNMTIRNGRYGIRSYGGNISLLNCTFYNNGWDGTPYDSPPTQANASEMWASSFTSNGGAMRIQDSGESELAYLTVYDNARAIRFQDGDNGYIHDNVAYNNIESGIYLAASSYTGATGCTNTIVTDNEIYGNMNDGMLSIGGKNNTFSNNYVHDNWNSGMQLWHISENYVDNNTIINNNLYGFNGVGALPGDARGGIAVEGGDIDPTGAFVVIITNNTVSDNQIGASSDAIGIYIDDSMNDLTGSQAINISDNTIVNQTIGLYVQGGANNTNLGDNEFVNVTQILEDVDGTGNITLTTLSGEGVEIDFNSQSGYNYFNVSTVDAGTNLTNGISKYWNLTTDMSTFNVDVVFSYEDDDIPAGVLEATLQVYYDDGGGWTLEAGGVVDTVANTVTLSGLTHFTDFTLGGGTTVTTNDATPPYASNDQENVTILEILVITGGADTLEYVNVTFNGTDVADVTNATVWYDTDGDGDFEPSTDDEFLLGATFSGGEADINLNHAVGAATTQRYWVVYNLAGTASVADTVDGSIAPGGIFLTTAGANAEWAEEAGSTEIGSGFYAPFLIYGIVYDEGPAPVDISGTTQVDVTNANTGETISVDTLGGADTGKYDANLGNFPSGWSNGDVIYVNVSGWFGGLDGTTMGTVDDSGPWLLNLDVYLDDTAPSITINNPTAVGGDYLGNIEINATITDAVGGDNTTYHIQINSLAWTQLVYDGGDDWIIAVFDTNTLADGTNYVNVTAEDEVGNNNTVMETFVVDNTAPAITINNPTGGDFVDTIELNATIAEAGSNWDNTTYHVQINSLAWTQLVYDGGDDWIIASYDTSILPDGTNYINITAEDSLGNNDTQMGTFTTDNTAPVITINNPVIGGSPYSGTIDVNATIVEAGTNWDNTTYKYQINSDDWVVLNWDSANWFIGTNDTSFLGAGTQYINVTAEDNLGNNASAQETFTLDNGAPVVVINNPTAAGSPYAGTIEINASITDSNPAVGTFKYQIDSGEWLALTLSGGNDYVANNDTTFLSDGTHYVNVTAEDTFANNVTVMETFVVDNTAPVITINTPTGGDLVGTIELNATIAEAGSNWDNTTYHVQINSLAWTQLVYDGGDDWIIASYDTSILPDGTNYINVTAEDNLGNNDTQMGTFTTDNTAPVITINTPTGGDLVGTIELNATIAEAGSNWDNTTYHVQINSLAWTQLVYDGGDDWIIASYDTSILPDGTNYINVTAEDNLGNNDTQMGTFTTDNTAPVITINTPTGGDLVGTIELNATIAEAGSNWDNTTYHVQINSLAWTQLVYDGGDDWIIASYDTSILPDGTNYINVTAEDSLGNNDTQMGTFTTDNTIPAITINNPVLGSDYVGTIELNATIVEAGTNWDNTTYHVQINSLEWTQLVYDGGNDWIIANYDTSILPDGTNYINVTAEDNLGNNDTQMGTFTTDNTAPVITINTPTGGDLVGTIELNATIAEAGSNWDNTTYHVQINSLEWTQLVYDGGNDWIIASYDTSILPDGTNYINITAEDNLGNNDTQMGTFTTDNTAPVITINTPTGGDLVGTIELNATIAEAGSNWDNTTYHVQINSLAWTQLIYDGGNDWIIANYDTSILPDGTNYINITAEDNLGNNDTQMGTFTTDNTAPVITINNPTAVGSDYRGTIEINATIVEARTNWDNTTYRYQIDSGEWLSLTISGGDDFVDNNDTTFLADGTHYVNVTVEDNLGNNDTVMETFVVDNTAPTFATTVAFSTDGTDVDGDGAIDNGDTINITVVVTDANFAGPLTLDVDASNGTDNPVTMATWDGGTSWAGLYVVGGAEFTTSNVDVSGTDDAGNTGTENDDATYDISGSYTINYAVGWNIFSIPVLNPTYSGGTLLDAASDIDAAAGGDVVMITQWNSATQEYENFISGFHSVGGVRDFAVSVDEAYWVWYDAASSFDIDGDMPHARNVAVVDGWNLVGWTDTTVGDANTDWAPDVAAGGLDAIAGWNTATELFEYYVFPADILALTPGKGYFVWSDGASTLTYGS